MLKLGLDEAGRGPVIGPLVIAGCLIDESKENELKKLGIKDSKLLAQKKRDFLFEKIKEIAEAFEIVIIYPPEIDESNEKGINLNELEALAFSEVINKINNKIIDKKQADKKIEDVKVIIDCPSRNPSKWEDFLIKKLNDIPKNNSNLNFSNLSFICEHKADVNYVVVSAASILAKTIREREMDKLKMIYGNQIGSGYCHDPLTIEFIRKNIKNYDNEGIFRKTWSTWKEAFLNLNQKNLLDF